MRASSRRVLCLEILDGPQFFFSLAKLAEQDGNSVAVEIDGENLGQARLDKPLPPDRIQGAINLKVLFDGFVVVSFHDSMDNAFAEMAIAKYIQVLSKRSLVRYKECSLELGLTERIFAAMKPFFGGLRRKKELGKG